jgi:FkbH-like protein
MATPELRWLVPPAARWSDALRGLGDQPSEANWQSLVGLANHAIDFIQTQQLDRRLQRLFGAGPPPGLATKPVRLAILSSSTTDHLLPSLRIGALRRGLWLSIYTGTYGQYAQELRDNRSALYAFGPDTILFALDARHVTTGFDAGMSPAEAAARTEEIATTIVSNWRAARSAFGCKIIQQTILPVFPPLFGSNEHRLPGSEAAVVQRLNLRLRELAESEHADLVSLDVQLTQDGLAAWHDPVLWHRAKQDVHPAAGPVYGDLVARLLAAQQGRSFKCLVLDLDNTLWGGVIGDDGLDGIVLGQGSALGEAYVAFQSYVRALSRRGIILAVCSKNDEANALEPFERHPDMVLKRSDIACFVANWTDKPANLRTIAERLNIGLDALVFADDNPFEREMVRREHPMVAVPELPEDPAIYADRIAQAGYFEGLHLTDEDTKRTHLYLANLKREELASSTTDMDAYLRSLNMELRWSRFDKIGLQRIVQLINKTNQFNLTTKRTTDEAINAAMADSRVLSLQLRLLDRFGDNGIIAIIIGRFESDSQDMLIDTWLMSCRVLGRQVEEATLNLIAAQAARLGARQLIGEYRPTAKNEMVREHYRTLGFTPLGTRDEGTTRWVLPLDLFQPLPTHVSTVGT